MPQNRRLSVLINLIFMLALIITMVGCQRNADANPPVIEPRKPLQMEEFMGVNVMFTLYDPVGFNKQISALKALGIKWIRLGVHWYSIEPKPGQHDYVKLDAVMNAIKAAGLNSLVYVIGPPKHQSKGADMDRPDQYPPADNSVYGKLLVELANRYPQVTAWQIWNEPNLRMFWQPESQPDAYNALVSSAAVMMQQSIPNRIRVLGGMAYWSVMVEQNKLMFEALSKLHTFELVDAVAYHPYMKTPYGDPDSNDPYNFITRGLWLNDALRKLGAKQIWVTEWGWGSYKTNKLHDEMITEPDQAEYTLKRLALMMAMGFDKSFYFNIADLPEYVELPLRDSGLIRLDATPKPSYMALARFLKLTNGNLNPIAAPSMEGSPSGLWQFNWQKDNGKKLWIVWADTPINVALTNVSGAVRINDLVPGTVSNVNPVNGKVVIPVSGSPMIVELP
jgi:polysaccharide biosynthesis protein PslG